MKNEINGLYDDRSNKINPDSIARSRTLPYIQKLLSGRPERKPALQP